MMAVLIRLLCLIAVLGLARSADGQSAKPVTVVETMADLRLRKPITGETVQVRHYSTNRLWDAPRTFYETAATVVTNAHDGVHHSTNAAAGRRYVSLDRLDPIQNVRWWGVAGDDTSDDSAAFNAAARWCRTNSLGLFIPKASLSYRCTNQIDLRGIANVEMEFDNDTAALAGGIRTEASGVGVLVGGTSASAKIAGARVRLKVVRYSADWTSGGACVSLNNMLSSDLTLHLFGSEKNLVIAPATDEYLSYNVIRIINIGYGKRNISIEPTGSGYVNGNQFVSGQLTLARVNGADPEANVWIGCVSNTQAADNVFREIDFNGTTTAWTNAAMFVFSPGGTTSGAQYGLLGNRVESGRFEVGGGIRVPLVKVLSAGSTNQTVEWIGRTMKYDTTIYSVDIPQGSEHYILFEDDAVATWVGEGNRRSISRPVAGFGTLPALFVDGADVDTFGEWGNLRAPGRTVYRLDAGFTNAVPGPRIAAPAGQLAAFESTNFIVGQRYTKSLFREAFLKLSDEIPVGVVAFDTNGAPLGGTAPAYVVGKSWQSRTNGSTPYYTTRGGWLWLHQDVASVVIGYNPWFLASDTVYRDVQVEHLWGASLEWSPLGMVEQLAVTTGPPRTPQPVGSMLADSGGLGYWQCLAFLTTTATAPGAFGTNTVYVSDTTGVQTNDLVSVQTPSDTIAGLPRIAVSRVSAVTSSNVTVSPLMGSGIESGAVVRFQRWRFATNSWGSAAYRDVPSSGNANSQQVVLGNDSRLDDARTPVAHNHVMTNITDSTEFGRSILGSPDRFVAATNGGFRNVAGLGIEIDSPAQFYFRQNFGTNISGTAFRRINFQDTARVAFTVVGDPTSADEIVLSSDIVGGSLGTNLLSSAALASLTDRGTHTGTQAISTITGLQSALDGKQATNARLTELSGLTPSTGQVPTWNGSSWAASNAPAGGGGGVPIYVNGVTNSWDFITDFTASGPSVRLSDSGVTAGTYTNPVVTVDAKGRTTAISSGTTYGTTTISNVMQRVASASWDLIWDGNTLGADWSNYVQNVSVSGLITAVVLPSATTNSSIGTPPFPDTVSARQTRINLAASGGLSSGLVYVFTDRIRQTTNIVQTSKTNSGWGQTGLSIITDTLVSTNLPLLVLSDPGVTERTIGTANNGIHYWTNSYRLDVFAVTNIDVAAVSYQAGTNVVISGSTISVARSPSRMWAGGVGGGATNTTAECTVFDSTFPDLDDGDMVEFRVQGPYMVLAAASVQLRVRVYVNGVVAIDGNSPSVTSSTLVRPWNLLGYIQREGASSGHVSASLGISSSSPTTGIGSWTTAINSPRLVMGTNAAAAWGSTTNTLKVTITPSSSSATNVWSANWWIGR